MIPISPDKSVEVIAGTTELQVSPREPYSPLVMDFLAALSTDLQKHAREFPDVGALAFWCRKGNLIQLSRQIKDDFPRIGRGLTVHIAPSNVPVNFAFSWIFGLISGSSNIVRLPSKNFPQVDLICKNARQILQDSAYTEIFASNSLVRYPANDQVTSRFFDLADTRLLWGGDLTISHLRAIPCRPQTVDVAFADRYSISLLGTAAVQNMDNTSLKNLAEGFYNDTYLMDQNACSSPHLILWVGENRKKAQDRFWKAIRALTESRYHMDPIHNVDKYTLLSKNLMQGPEGQKANLDSPFLYRVDVPAILPEISEMRGLFGLFYEAGISSLRESDVLKKLVSKKYQTATYFGVDPNEVAALIQEGHLLGIDRVVPVGKALDIGVYWDGFDIVRTLSRVIFIQ